MSVHVFVILDFEYLPLLKGQSIFLDASVCPVESSRLDHVTRGLRKSQEDTYTLTFDQ